MLKKEEMIEKLTKIHGNTYNYSILEEEINDVLSKIHYICKEHGVVEQIFYNHLQGKGCSECAKINRRNKKCMTLGELLEKSKNKHNDLDKYDWDNIDLTNRDEKNRVQLKCKEHGYFSIRLSHFINGVGCQYCNGRKKDYEKIKEQLSEMHPTLDFSNSTFGNYSNDYATTYICPKHGLKSSRMYNLLHGEGCYECSMEQNGINQRLSFEEFIERCRNTQDVNDYVITEENYNNRDENGKITIICKKHGEFKIIPRNFMVGHGCAKCANEKHSTIQRRSVEELNTKLNELYGNKYSFVNIGEYKNAKTPLQVKCNDCGNIFVTNLNNLFNSRNGCPFCQQSSLEQVVNTMLKENHIKFHYRAKKNILPWIQRMELDFYLPDYNIGIECQGGQHFISVDLWGGEENLKKTVERDEIKYRLCQENGIDLLYFSKDIFNSKYDIYTDTKDILNYIKSKQL